ncbi:MAG: type II secretion system F family protein [Planctomycetota bacterium]
MPVYAYTGTSADGSPCKGTVTAASPRAGRDQLRDAGVKVATLSPMGTSVWSWASSWWGVSRARSQWTGAAHELSMLLRAGISLDDALRTLATQYRGTLRDSLTRLDEEVMAGRSLADAMTHQPRIFDPASIRLIEVGENAGTLEVVLEELAEFKQRLAEFGDKVTTALMYPVFLLIFGTGAMLFLMTWVLPPLLENLEETLIEIPWPTRVAKTLSDGLVGHGGKLVLCFGVAMLILVVVSRGAAGRRFWHAAVLRLPLIGPVLVKQLVARVSMIIGLLMRSGIPLDQAVELASRSTTNSVMQDVLTRCGHDLTAGRDMATSLSNSGLFTPLAVRVFSVGQDSGQLDSMLTRLGEDYNHQVQLASTRLTALMEPVLILVMALLVGFLLVATILPILQAGQMV